MAAEVGRAVVEVVAGVIGKDSSSNISRVEAQEGGEGKGEGKDEGKGGLEGGGVQMAEDEAPGNSHCEAQWDKCVVRRTNYPPGREVFWRASVYIAHLQC